MIKKQTYDGRVKRAVKREQDRWGFIDYYGAARVTAKVHDVLDRADLFLEQGRTLEAIWIYQAVIEGVVPAMAHADDSAGILSGTINYACEGLRRAAEGASEQERAELFAYCVRNAPLEPYSDWDRGWELVELAGELVRTAAERMALFAALDKMAGRRDKGYGPELAALIKLSVMRRMDDDTAVQGFMEEQIRHEKIRQALARFHLAKGNLDLARNICYEWLDDAPPRKPGLRDYFWEVLLEVAEAEGDREEQSRLCEILFRDRHDFDYLERLKVLIGEQEWPAYRVDLLERIKGDLQSWMYLGELYVHEEMWTELLSYAQQRPEIVEGYYEYLGPRYPREVSGVYEQLALETLHERVNRKGYRKVCRYLKVMQRLGEQERVETLLAQWRVEYQKRPALLDELNKNFGKVE